MTRPLIYFSYGMTKSGSTLAYELARSGLVLSGYDQPRLSLSAVMNRKKLNFCAHIDEASAQAIRRETRAIGHTIAFKTHTRPDPIVVNMLQEGEATAHAVYRDPREMALSMLDHGVKSRENGRPGFAEYHTLEDTLSEIGHQLNSLKSWLSLPNVRPLYYEDVAFDMAATTALILGELDLTSDPDAVMKMATQDRFTQMNKAKRARHEDEMSSAQSDRFVSIFAGLYDTLITGRAALPRDGRPCISADIDLCDWSQIPSGDST